MIWRSTFGSSVRLPVILVIVIVFIAIVAIGIGFGVSEAHDLDDFVVRLHPPQQPQPRDDADDQNSMFQRQLEKFFQHVDPRWCDHPLLVQFVRNGDEEFIELHLRNEHQVDALETFLTAAASNTDTTTTTADDATILAKSRLERVYLQKLNPHSSKQRQPQQQGSEEEEEENQQQDGYFRYHNYENMTEFLHNVVEQHSDIARLFSIGQSLEKRELWVVHISTNISLMAQETTTVRADDNNNSGQNVTLKRLPKPRFKYIANMHGDEVVGRECLIFLIDYLCSQFGIDSAVTELVDNLDIFIMPSMNPDGFERDSRGNINDVDLNRNFPDQFVDSVDSVQGREPETRAVMEWIKSAGPFALSANFHGGALVANYPWDGRKDGRQDITSYEKSPDDDLFVHLALTYSLNHPRMHKSVEFHNGITNGAMWYPLYGGMQDYNYVWQSCFELTIELSNVKHPLELELQNFWEENRAAMLAYMHEALTGIRGFVLDDKTNLPIASATIEIAKQGDTMARKKIGVDAANGDFYRLVSSAGTYEVRISAPGFASISQTVTLSEEQPSIEITWRLHADDSGIFNNWGLTVAIAVTLIFGGTTLVFIVVGGGVFVVLIVRRNHLRHTRAPPDGAGRWQTLEMVSVESEQQDTSSAPQPALEEEE